MAYGGRVKTHDDIRRELEALIQAHYYSEDFELISAVRAYQDRLTLEERDELKGVVVSRLLAEGSMVDVVLCSVVQVPPAGPLLAAKLDRESVPSQLTRALMASLQLYPGDEAYRAVERFLDSDQEGEALAALARLDFNRTLPHLARALDREHFLGPILHILHARAKDVGVPALGLELVSARARLPAGFSAGLARVFAAKSGAYNPFSVAELDRLRGALA
jgi:hypothetical protein